MSDRLTDAYRSQGDNLYAHVRALYPGMRSITGPGVRDALDYLSRIVPIERRSVPSGRQVLDWTVPPEWHFRTARIEDRDGRTLVDAADSTLHVVNFSVGVDAVLTGTELAPHLHSLPGQPDAVPYRTTYYREDWGFCLSQRVRDALGNGPFRVVIDADHRPGVLDWGEVIIPGRSAREILVSTHICHPSLANDNLSGMVLAATLAAERLRAQAEGLAPSPFTWRFLFVPGTIGAISWLASLGETVPDVAGALVLTGLGDRSRFHWKATSGGDAWIDRIVMQVLRERHPDNHERLAFSPYGYDERQYGSPGYRFPAGRLTRGVHGTFPEYHTSLDDLDFVRPEGLAESMTLLRSIGHAIDSDVVFRNLQPYGEPQLGKRGLYGATGGLPDPGASQMAMLWLLNRSDGEHSLTDIATEADLPLSILVDAARLLETHGLLDPIGHGDDAW